MPLVDLASTPSRSMRRWFGLSLAVLLAIVAFMASKFAEPLNAAILFAAIAVAFVYYSIPATQLAIIRFWQYITFPLAWIVGHLLFGLIYFGVVLPVGIALRIRGYDPLRLKPVRRDSYWHDRSPPPPTERYFKQF